MVWSEDDRKEDEYGSTSTPSVNQHQPILPHPWQFPVNIVVHRSQSIVVPRGLEPRTLRLLAVRSNQLSYETSGSDVWRLLPKKC